MRFFVNLYGNEAEFASPGTPEFDAELAQYAKFDEVAGDAVVAGEALQPSPTAVTVRAGADTDAPLVTSGPFAETTEVIGGYYVLEADTLDDAIELARQLPAATVNASGHGAVEVRPLVQWWTPEVPPEAPSGQRYLAMIYGEETAADIPNTPEWDQGAANHGQFIDKHLGSLHAGAALHPVATATTVRVKDGELLVTDGPFTETAEVLGGLYQFHAVTRDEAVALAADIPCNPGGGIEIRPVMELEPSAGDGSVNLERGPSGPPERNNELEPSAGDGAVNLED